MSSVHRMPASVAVVPVVCVQSHSTCPGAARHEAVTGRPCGQSSQSRIHNAPGDYFYAMHFFSQRPLATKRGVVALIATQVRWVHGGRGLLAEECPDGRHHYRSARSWGKKLSDRLASDNTRVFVVVETVSLPLERTRTKCLLGECSKGAQAGPNQLV
jgi:hypothetical protein